MGKSSSLFAGAYRQEVEKAMAPHSSTLAWKITWMEEPGRLQSMGSLWVGHDWTTSIDFSLLCIGEGNGNPLQCSCLENPRDRGAWWAAVYGVTQSQTQLKWLSNIANAFLLQTFCISCCLLLLLPWPPPAHSLNSAQISPPPGSLPWTPHPL